MPSRGGLLDGRYGGVCWKNFLFRIVVFGFDRVSMMGDGEGCLLRLGTLREVHEEGCETSFRDHVAF